MPNRVINKPIIHKLEYVGNFNFIINNHKTVTDKEINKNYWHFNGKHNSDYILFLRKLKLYKLLSQFNKELSLLNTIIYDYTSIVDFDFTSLYPQPIIKIKVKPEILNKTNNNFEHIKDTLIQKVLKKIIIKRNGKNI